LYNALKTVAANLCIFTGCYYAARN